MMVSMLGLTIRSATANDSDVILALRNDPTAIAMSESGRAIGEQEHREWFTRILHDTAHHRVLMADCDGMPVGAVRFDRQGDAAMVSLAVSPSARRKGVGHRLLEDIVFAARAAGCTSADATIHEDNLISQRLFASHGFHRVKVDPTRWLYYRRLI